MIDLQNLQEAHSVKLCFEAYLLFVSMREC
nr:MAG TPA: RHD-n-terminal sub-domain of the Rel homology domain (RHD) [Caudoviricetes sp.]